MRHYIWTHLDVIILIDGQLFLFLFAMNNPLDSVFLCMHIVAYDANIIIIMVHKIPIELDLTLKRITPTGCFSGSLLFWL